MPTLRSQKQPSICLLSDRPAHHLLRRHKSSCSLPRREFQLQCTLFSLGQGEIIAYVYTIKVLSTYLVKNFVTMYCFRMLYWMRHGVQGIRDWKKMKFNRIVRIEKSLKDCSKAFSLPKQCQDVVETNGCKTMAALYNAYQNDSLAPITSIRYNMLCKKVARAKIHVFITPE